MNNAEKTKQFIEAYDKFSDSIFRYCFLRVWSEEAARDLAQETFIRAWDYISEGNEVRNFRPFLFRVATNLIIDESRKKKTISLDYLKEKGMEPRLTVAEDFLTSFEFKKAVETIETLDEKYRDALLLRYVEDLPVKEIAQALGETEDNISVRLHRGLEKMKQVLEEKQNYERK